MASTRLFAVVLVSIRLLASAEIQAADSADCAGAVVDENSVPVGAAQVKVENSAGKVFRTETDGAGRFILQNLPEGDYKVEVRKEGFFLLSGQSFSLHARRNELTLTLNHVQELHEHVQVTAPSNQIDTQDTSRRSTLSSQNIRDIPVPNSHVLAESLVALPEIVRDSRNILHIAGARSGETQYLLDGFEIGDPVNGALTARFNIDATRAAEVQTGRFSAGYAHSGAGILSLETPDGEDRWRFGTTNPAPGINIQEGAHLGNWYPRVTFSGPIERGRFWFSDAISIQHTFAVVKQLPSNANPPPSPSRCAGPLFPCKPNCGSTRCSSNSQSLPTAACSITPRKALSPTFCSSTAPPATIFSACINADAACRPSAALPLPHAIGPEPINSLRAPTSPVCSIRNPPNARKSRQSAPTELSFANPLFPVLRIPAFPTPRPVPMRRTPGRSPNASSSGPAYVPIGTASRKAPWPSRAPPPISCLLPTTGPNSPSAGASTTPRSISPSSARPLTSNSSTPFTIRAERSSSSAPSLASSCFPPVACASRASPLPAPAGNRSSPTTRLSLSNSSPATAITVSLLSTSNQRSPAEFFFSRITASTATVPSPFPRATSFPRSPNCSPPTPVPAPVRTKF